MHYTMQHKNAIKRHAQEKGKFRMRMNDTISKELYNKLREEGLAVDFVWVFSGEIGGGNCYWQVSKT